MHVSVPGFLTQIAGIKLRLSGRVVNTDLVELPAQPHLDFETESLAQSSPKQARLHKPIWVQFSLFSASLVLELQACDSTSGFLK